MAMTVIYYIQTERQVWPKTIQNRKQYDYFFRPCAHTMEWESVARIAMMAMMRPNGKWEWEWP